ncbi:MAG: DNA gyrase subunit A [Candidatus Anstonellales archaeon]
MKLINETFEQNLKSSYLTYALSVITGRAIPDVRDGLKPVQRRILYSMYELGLMHNKPFKKSARIVGETLGKYHPHGDAPIYEALVRLAQPFSMNHPLIEGQGNFGSIDGDPPAAMRYTEARLSEIAEELFRDLPYDVVEFQDNFDNSIKEPKVLPVRFPNLLVNGASGIAVGIATEIPPHNLAEIIDGTIAIIRGENPLKYIKGPDFPTGGILYRMDENYMTSGIGKIELVAKYRIDTERNSIIIEEIPYGVAKIDIVRDLLRLKDEGKIRGIKSVVDRSGKDIQIEIVIDRNYKPEHIINSILNQTMLRKVINARIVVLDEGKPVTMGIPEILSRFIEFRKQIIVRRAQHFRDKYRKSLEKVESMIFAVQNIDRIIRILREEDVPELKLKEMGLNDQQISYILDMNLRSLRKQELGKLVEERAKLINMIAEQERIISDPIPTLIAELEEIKHKYSVPRRTQIDHNVIIQDYDYRVGIVYSDRGLKKIAEPEITDRFKRTGIKYGDGVLGLVIVNNRSKIAVFTEEGEMYKIDVNSMDTRDRDDPFEEISKYGIQGKIVKILPYYDREIVILTERGAIKRMQLDIVRSKARVISERERVVDVNYLNNDYVTVVSKEGKAIRFEIDELRTAGRAAGGVKGITGTPLRVITSDRMIVGSTNGYIKEVNLSEIRVTSRGGKGVFIYKPSKRSGEIADVCNYSDEIVAVINDTKVARVRLADLKSGKDIVGRKVFSELKKIYNI